MTWFIVLVAIAWLVFAVPIVHEHILLRRDRRRVAQHRKTAIEDRYRYTQYFPPSPAQRLRTLEHDTAMCSHRELGPDGWYCPLRRAEAAVSAWQAEITASKEDGTWNRFAYDVCPLCGYRIGALRVVDHLEEHLKELST
jgi:hypothetical protein